jgi:hypothetical protein
MTSTSIWVHAFFAILIIHSKISKIAFISGWRVYYFRLLLFIIYTDVRLVKNRMNSC